MFKKIKVYEFHNGEYMCLYGGRGDSDNYCRKSRLRKVPSWRIKLENLKKQKTIQDY